jgi:hypothetical protein
MCCERVRALFRSLAARFLRETRRGFAGVVVVVVVLVVVVVVVEPEYPDLDEALVAAVTVPVTADFVDLVDNALRAEDAAGGAVDANTLLLEGFVVLGVLVGVFLVELSLGVSRSCNSATEPLGASSP